MSFFAQGLDQAWDMIVHRDPYLEHLTWVTIKVAVIPAAVATALGTPVAVALGIGRFFGRGLLLVLANAGLVMPPVTVGLVLSLLMFPRAPLGALHLLFTLRGVYLAQTILALPVVVALGASALRAVDPALLAQARAYRANRAQVAWLAIREARVGMLATLILAVGSGLSEVAAVVLVGGNIQGLDQTLGSASLQAVNAGQFSLGLAIAIVLLALIVLVTAVLTFLQYRGSTHGATGRHP